MSEKQQASVASSGRFAVFSYKATPYLYVAPFFILFLVVGLFPLLFTVWVAMRNYNTITGDSGWAVCGAVCGTRDQSLVGNFQWVLHQRDFWMAMRNTVSIFLLSSVPQIIAAVFIAWVLNANLKAKTFWRMGVLLPYVIAPSACGIIFSQIFSDKSGAFNVLLQTIGLAPIAWHADTLASHIAIATIVNFRWTGYNSLILLAAMQAIPTDLIEAAVVDGAGKARTFFSVTLPLLKPTLIFVILNSTIGGLQIFDEVQMFNNGTGAAGGANNQFLTVSLYLYNLGFNKVTIGESNIGRAAAVAWLLFLVIVLVAVVNFSITRKLADAETRGKKRMQKKAQ
ncbi:carbohydrate ABC transporter permease [Alloscardovia macacae]|uniref:ABC transporter permease n=1 Tax=Alloscardovia macacae TaxID=1160091 RepID=A0A261F6E3_9BIFI|nr:sugar ABC transporter permease [Alloscardovia macacae]OZG54658.1 ABC transporter permease [Alloscardovia macacae]